MNRRIFLFPLIFSLFLNSPPLSFGEAAGQNPKADELLDEASRLQSFHQIEPAIQKYEAARALKPNDPTILQNLGVLYFEARHYEKAIELLRLSLLDHQNNPQIHLYLAKSYMALNQPGPAETEFQQALTMDPGLADAQYGLGLLLGERGEIDRAEELYRSVVSKNPNHAGASFELGRILYRRGNLAQSKEAFEHAVSAAPDMLSAHYNLGIVYRELGDFEKSREEFKRAISLDPGNPGGFYQAALTYEQQGFLEEAEKGYEEALSINPHFNEAHDRLLAVREKLSGRQEDISESKGPRREIPLFGGSFGKGGFKPTTPLDPFGNLNDNGSAGSAKFDSKSLLWQAGAAVLQQWMNSRNQAANSNSDRN